MVTALGPWISVLMGERGMKERGTFARKGPILLDPLECGGLQKDYIGHTGHSGWMSLKSFSCYIPQARRLYPW